jgi:hypothetical protein
MDKWTKWPVWTSDSEAAPGARSHSTGQPLARNSQTREERAAHRKLRRWNEPELSNIEFVICSDFQLAGTISIAFRPYVFSPGI